MKSVRFLSCAAVLLLFAVLAPRARADEWNQRTTFTFSGPVEIPGRVLPAGTYVFKLADSLSDRNIIEVFNKKQTHLYGIFLAIPDYRMHPTGKTIITFRERAANSPEAVKAWFYPGDNYGHDFVYPKVKALELARVNNETVPSMPDEMAANTAATTAATKQPNVAAMKKAPIKAEQPNQSEVEVAQAFPPPANRAATTPPATPPPAAAAPVTEAQAQTPRQLPTTASPLPLIGLIGLLSLSAAGSLRYLDSRTK